MDRQWMYILLLVGSVTDIRANVNPNEPFIAMACRDDIWNTINIYVAPLNDDIDEPLHFSSVIPNPPIHEIKGVAYDPNNEELYYSVSSGARTVSKIKLDGSDEMEILSESTFDLAINPYTNKLIRKKVDGPYPALHISDLDGSNDDEISDRDPTDFGIFGSRLMMAIDDVIYSADAEDGSLFDDETYDLSAITPEKARIDVDIETGVLYFIGGPSNPLAIMRLKINDYSATCVELFVDTRNEPRMIYGNDIAVHGDYVYITGHRDEFNSGLFAYNRYTGNATNVNVTGLPGPDGSRVSCKTMHIHDPAKIAADKSFAGATHYDDDDSADNANATAPRDVPLIIREGFFGGMIADMVIPITGRISDWKLEISFPRQVFKVEIEGCSAEVSQKQQRNYGRRKGTDIVIVPTGESLTPPPGEDLKITLLAETWGKLRNMKRGISARFIPGPPPVPITLSCDNNILGGK